MNGRSECEESSSTTKQQLKEDDIMMTSKISRMSFEPARHSVDQSMNLNGKVISYRTRIISEPTYEDKLVKNLAMEICYELINTNPNSICIVIKICLGRYR